MIDARHKWDGRIEELKRASEQVTLSLEDFVVIALGTFVGFLFGVVFLVGVLAAVNL